MATLIERQIEDWEKRGVVDAPTAARLRDDIHVSGRSKARSRRRFSFFQVVAFFAAISIGAAILIFIAANWEAIPRVGRVAGVIVAIFAGFAAGAFFNRRQGLRMILVEEACYLVGGLAFVGGVALVAQMYHISGDAQSALMLHTIALGLAGFAVRSRALVTLAAIFLTIWQLNGPDAERVLSLQFAIFAGLVAAGIAFSTWMKARWMRRLFYLALAVGLVPFAATFVGDVIEWIVDFYDGIPEAVRNGIWIGVWLAALAGMFAQRFAPQAFKGLPGGAGGRAGGFFLLGLLAVAFLHGELDGDAGLIVASLAGVVFVLAALFAHGRDNQFIRYVSYVVFVGEILTVYGSTIYSMLGTSGFFLALGIVLALIALVVYRLEKRWRAGQGRREADA